MVDSLLYAKIPPYLKRSINRAYLENVTYEQIFTLSERLFELRGLKTDGELPIPTMTTTTTTLSKETNSTTKC